MSLVFSADVNDTVESNYSSDFEDNNLLVEDINESERSIDLKNDSLNYLSAGEYNVISDVSYSNISICGNNSIIHGNGHVLTLDNRVDFKCIVLDNFTIVNNAKLNISNSNIIASNLTSNREVNIYNSILTDVTLNNEGVLNIESSQICGKCLNIDGIANFININLTNVDIYNYGVFNVSNSKFNEKGVLINNNVTNLNKSEIIEFNIVNKYCFNAFNCIFMETIGFSDNGYDNNYGGAIYAPNNLLVNLDNCSFSNNSAEYGGAIYIKNGNLTILNSKFSNNHAYNYGGSVSAHNVNLNVINSSIIGSKSLNDAGGALYIVSSSLSAYNLTIDNSQSIFGGAIAALKSNMNISGSNFSDNLARYGGGAIYQIYGQTLINDSKFINNAAKNGGGLFVDGVNYLNIFSNDFKNNNNDAIFTLSNEFNFTDNNFINNAVNYASITNRFVGDGNYTLYQNNVTFNSTLPSYYNLVDEGYVTEVKNQQDGGNCWAFAALASLESCILKASGEALDFSEENMKNLMASFSPYGWSQYSPNTGGNSNQAIAYLASWLGPVNDADDLYDGESSISPILKSLMHVQNVLFLKRNNFTDNDQIKEAILKYGAVATSMYWSGHLLINGENKVYHYYTGNESTNHAVTIVGWDDSVKVKGASGDGAWIVKNSWGPDWLKDYNCNGYFYASYYDTRFAIPGSYNSYTFILNDAKHFDKNYQYDISGKTDYLYVNQSTIYYKNLFNATDNEFLSAISTYFDKNTSWEITINVNGKLQLIQNGISVPGYYTINLNHTIPIVKGDIFEVIFKLTVEGDAGIPISEFSSLNKLTYSRNNSYLSFNGLDWVDLYDFNWTYPGHWYLSQVSCIKAFTQFKTLNSYINNIDVVYDCLNLFNITVEVNDEDNYPVGNGIVTFIVNGNDYLVNIYNGSAFLHVPLSIGINNISAFFKSPNYHSSQLNRTFNLLPIDLGLSIDIIQDYINAQISFKFSQPINGTLDVGQIGLIDVVNGKCQLNLTNLDYGDYTIDAKLKSDFYHARNSTTFFVNIKKTQLLVDNLTTVYKSGEFLTVKLIDEFKQPVVGRIVKLILENKTISDTTNEDGIVLIPIKLSCSVYNAGVVFESDDLYIGSQNSSVITVDSSMILPMNNIYALNSNYEVQLFNKNGNYLNNTQISVILNNHEYHILSDGKGKINFKIPLSYGNFQIQVINPETNEKSSQAITILKRITGNKDISIYQGLNYFYTLRVLSDSGLFKSNSPVYITINGKTYVKYSNDEGYISFNLKNFKSGKYSIGIEYMGFKVINKIIIKQIIIAKNIKVKKGNAIKLKAKILNSNGKPLKHKKVIFKIKGKKYKVKTNRKGIAKCRLPKNLIKKFKKGKKIKYHVIYRKNNVVRFIKIR